MKKLLTICLLIATAFTTNAQEGKPTKEQAVTFINKTLQSDVGSGVVVDPDNLRNAKIKTNVKFTYDKYEYTYNNDRSEAEIGYTKNYVYDNIRWDEVESIHINPKQDIGVWDNIEQNLRVVISVYFSTNQLRTTYQTGDRNKTDTFYNALVEFVLPLNAIEKAESFKKALERLVEIAKEENKDPFEN